MPKNCRCLWSVILVTAGAVSPVRAQDYPEASLDQATRTALDSLKIERLVDLNEDGLEAEYQWALDMARTCLTKPETARDNDRCHYAIEFQRHAGRTALQNG